MRNIIFVIDEEKFNSYQQHFCYVLPRLYYQHLMLSFYKWKMKFVKHT